MVATGSETMHKNYVCGRAAFEHDDISVCSCDIDIIIRLSGVCLGRL